MCDNATLTFQKTGGSFSLNHGPVKMWPGGMGVTGYAGGDFGTGAAGNVHSANNGVADIRAVRNLKIARVIRQGEVFSYGFEIARTTKNTKTDTNLALSSFIVATIWLWGATKNAIIG